MDAGKGLVVAVVAFGLVSLTNILPSQIQLCDALQLQLHAGREQCLFHEIYDPKDESHLQLKYFPDLSMHAPSSSSSREGGRGGGRTTVELDEKRQPNPDINLEVHVFPPKTGAPAKVYHIPETKMGKPVHIKLMTYEEHEEEQNEKKKQKTPVDDGNNHDPSIFQQRNDPHLQQHNKHGGDADTDGFVASWDFVGRDDYGAPPEDWTGVYQICFFPPVAGIISRVFWNIHELTTDEKHELPAGTVQFHVRSSSHEQYDSMQANLLHPNEQSYDATTQRQGVGNSVDIKKYKDGQGMHEGDAIHGGIGLDEVRGNKIAHRNMGPGEAITSAKNDDDQTLGGFTLQARLAVLSMHEVYEKVKGIERAYKAAQATGNSTFTRVWVCSVATMVAMALGAFLLHKQVTNQIRKKQQYRGRAA